MKKNRLFIFIFFAINICCCKNDIDVTENWKEIPVVFGLLNQSDSVQYIKVSKAFLGDADALVMAGNYDSINYGSQLVVKINEISNNSVINTYTLQRDTSIAKPSGSFSYPKQVFYKMSNSLDPANEYELVVTNTQSGHVCRSKTKLVKDFSIISPYPNQLINFTIPNSYFHVQFLSAEYGRLYNLVMRFWYTEINKVTGQVRERHVDMTLSDIKSNGIQGGETMEFSFPGNTFYTFLRAQIAPNDSLWRHVGKASNPNYHLDFILSVAGEDFATYLDVNKPVSGPLMEKPYYTNIENGIGLFSSRYTQKSPWLYDRQLTSASIDSIYAGQYTYNLGFCSPNITSPYTCN